jgi:radical SAM-linked protein
VTAPSDRAPRPANDPAEAAPPPPPAPEPRQRWRLTFARELPRAEEVPTGREYIGRWEDSLLASGLPVFVLAAGRPRVALGAPLPNGCSAEGELLEFWLTAVQPAWQVREALASDLQAGHRIVGLESVWVGAPALSGQIAAADYDVAIRVDGASGADVAAATGRLLARGRVRWDRQKGGETKTVDLRPLILALDASDATYTADPDAVPGGPLDLRMRTRIHPELGTGRPDEVVGALGAELGATMTIDRIVRRRLLLADEVGR